MCHKKSTRFFVHHQIFPHLSTNLTLNLFNILFYLKNDMQKNIFCDFLYFYSFLFCQSDLHLHSRNSTLL